MGITIVYPTKDKYKVYILRSCGYYYYGMSSHLYNRSQSHVKSVHDLIKNGDYLKEPSETGKLLIHHKIAKHIIKTKKSHTLSSISMNLGFYVCFESSDKDQALYVEAFLIKQSLSRNKCCNRRSDFMLLQGRKMLKTQL